MENKLGDYDEMTAIQLQMSQENEKKEASGKKRKESLTGDMKELS